MSTVDGKVCVVTGSGSGIGRALALELANRGARLALSDVNEAGLAETVEQVKMVGAQVHSQLLDVADRDAVRAYADAVVQHYGVVHQIYNNAGIAGSGATVLETEYAAYERILNVNLWGVINGTKEFLPHLIASGDGHVVNISSLNGIMGQPSLSGYCASKFAVRGFTESLRAEMITAGNRVNVSVVHPGGVKTNIATAAVVEAENDGVLTPDHAARARRYNEKLLKMPAAQAAKIIADGVEAGNARILVGNDARGIDVLVRVVPRLYPRLIAWLDGRLASAS
jgi:NAD(P)-dependent dehydrogenase (short-subunit alcohol dehydrogenase family)